MRAARSPWQADPPETRRAGPGGGLPKQQACNHWSAHVRPPPGGRRRRQRLLASELALNDDRSLLVDRRLFQGAEAGPAACRACWRSATAGRSCVQARDVGTPASGAGGRAGGGLSRYRPLAAQILAVLRRLILDSSFGILHAPTPRWRKLDPRTCCADGPAEPPEDLHHAARGFRGDPRGREVGMR
jgi:hypothetical protein